LTILKDVGDGIEGEIIICEYKEPKKINPKRVGQASGHRNWRIKIEGAYCVIEKKFRWLGTQSS